MDIQKIDQILNLIEKTSFIEVEVEQDGLRIRARKGASSSSSLKVEAKPEVEVKAACQSVPDEKNDKRVISRSPLVGTFYRAPSPNAPPFVEVGDLVKKGQVLCIVEAMKLMNEVESEVEGKIVSIYVENAHPVEYGEPLFLIETC
jgi:acetyl-CoA carboxylase biotin carboxyl carrier protein